MTAATTQASLFELATMKKLRYDSVRGPLDTEQLWDLPLTSKNGFSLDDVAKTANIQLKGLTEDSFVETSVKVGRADAELRLEVVKHIITKRMEANRERLQAAMRSQERAKLLTALERKQEEELSQLSAADIEARLKALDATS